MGFLFVDRIIELSPGEWIRGIKHIRPEEAYLCPDAQNKPGFIPSLIGETLGQLAAWNVMVHNQFTLRPVAGVVASAKLNRTVSIGETLLLESFIDKLDDQVVQYHSIAHSGKDVIFTIEGALGPLLPMEDFISKELVQDQFREINKPGDWSSLVQTEQTREIKNTKPLFSPITLTFDKILSSEPEVSICAEMFINPKAPYFVDHFPYKPVLPMTVLLECKCQLAQHFIAQMNSAQNYQLYELRKIKMNEFVPPGEMLITWAKVKLHTEGEIILSFRSEVRGKRVCVADIVFTARG